MRELLDAVLNTDGGRLGAMAGDAYSSPWHFAREVSRGAGEPPVSLRRRVMLERAAWQLRQGRAVTEVALEAGYSSVEGFSRAFRRAYGTAPSRAGSTGSHWLPAPNGIHFHPPVALWIEGYPRGRSDMDPTALLVQHDLDDTAQLLDAAAALPAEEWDRVRRPGETVLGWDGPEESVAAVLDHLVYTKEVWLASITGADQPPRGSTDPGSLRTRFEQVAPRWLAEIRDIERRDAWGDAMVDALCDPPESFVIGSVLAHVLTYSAYRRQLVRALLREAGHPVDHGDPIEWLRSRS
nr:helix-turn-helix domain-containing protein [Auraticoccus cholistanensis]